MKGSTYQQLCVFHAIAREGGITAAAKVLAMAPPSVSQSLSQLEKTLGLPLCTRTTRRVELTEAGQVLFHRTAPLLAELRLAVESVQDLSDLPMGSLKITVPRFAYQYFLAPIYGEFCRQYPEIQLEIDISDEAVDILKEGFDLGIRFGDKVAPEMIARSLTPPMKEALFASPEYLARMGTPKTLVDLSVHRLIQYRFIASRQIAPLILQDGEQAITVEMPTALIVNDTDLMLNAAEQGLGIGRMIEPVAREAMQANRVTPILTAHWQSYSGLYLYFHQNTQKAKRVRVFIDFLMEKARSFW